MVKKRLISTTAGLAIATMLMGAGFIGTANADEVANNDIVISAPNDGGTNMKAPTINGRQFTAYRIGEYRDAQLDGADITGYDLDASEPMNTSIRTAIAGTLLNTDGTVKTPWGDRVAKDGSTVKFIGEAANLSPIQFVGKYFYGTGVDKYGNDHADKAEMRLFAQKLAKATNGFTGVEHKQATGAGGKATFPIDNEGLYLIVQNGGDTDASETIASAMVTGTPIKVSDKWYDTVKNGDKTYKLGELNLKAEKVILTKTVDNTNPTRVNSQRKFTINTNVPDYVTEYPAWDASTIKFSITDNPSSNVSPDLNSITVHVDNKALIKGNNFTVDNNGNTDTNDFRINIINPTTYSGKDVTVEYNGTITALTSTDDTAKPDNTLNTAEAEFSNDPNANTTGTVNDTERLFNTGLTLEKVKMSDRNTKLADAEFRVTSDGNPVYFNKAADGLSYEMTGDSIGNVNTVKFGVNDGGTIKPVSILGLGGDKDSAVTYTFTETKAPAGYVLGEKPVTFNVTVTPNYDNHHKLTGVTAKVASNDHANFIDLSDTDLRGVNGKTVQISNDTSKLDLGKIEVENTTNINDFAKTGGEVLMWAGLAAGLAIAGGAAIAIAKKREHGANIA